jgi:hypothetical protein
MSRYRLVIFLSGDDFDKWYDEFNSEGWDNGFEYLLQWEYGDGEATDSEPWGAYEDSMTFFDGDLEYVVSYNYNLAYVSLTEVIR